MINIRKLESELWESADLLWADSKLAYSQYCMPVLKLISCGMPIAGSNWGSGDSKRPFGSERACPVRRGWKFNFL